MVGHFAADDTITGPRPGVLVCHEGSGLDDHAKGRAERLAGLGYSAFALDYFGAGKPPPRGETMERLGPLMGDPERTRAIATAGLDVLLAQPETDGRRVAATGYCFGGTMALEMARVGADLRAVVGFHSGRATSRPEDARNIKASILVCIGADDPFVPPEQRAAFEQEMRDGGVADWRMELYGGVVHSFTNPSATGAEMPGIRFHEPSDRRSWQSMLHLFDERFG
jgi:dienelactone hydrolase